MLMNSIYWNYGLQHTLITFLDSEPVLPFYSLCSDWLPLHSLCYLERKTVRDVRRERVRGMLLKVTMERWGTIKSF